MENQFFTAADIGSFTSCTAIIVIATSALVDVFKLPQKTTAFTLAIIIAFLNLLTTSSLDISGITAIPLMDWIMFPFNACTLYCASLGANQTIANAAPTVSRAVPGKGDAAQEIEAVGVFSKFISLIKIKSWE